MTVIGVPPADGVPNLGIVLHTRGGDCGAMSVFYISSARHNSINLDGRKANTENGSGSGANMGERVRGAAYPSGTNARTIELSTGALPLGGSLTHTQRLSYVVCM